jgi:hypothetical protein
MPENFKISLLRADDLLALDFEFLNLRLDANGDQAPRLVRTQPGLPAFVIVQFPPQHVAEQVFTEDVHGALEGLLRPPVGSILSGSSRLAFRVPDQTQAIPLTLEGLLDWTQYELAVAPSALPPGAESDVEPAPPTPEQTAIELPYRLIISPDASAGWAHASQAVTHGGRTELWHTRLRLGNGHPPGFPEHLGGNVQATVRAIWSPDRVEVIPSVLSLFQKPHASLGSLTATQRVEIVELSSDFSIVIEDHSQAIDTGIPGPPAKFSYQPSPVSVDHLMLSSLGGWLHAYSAWDFPEIDGVRLRLKGADPLDQRPVFSLTDWRHITGMGRDQYVRTVDKGFLYPFGNRASLVRITERKFRPAPTTGESVAYLAQRSFIVVQQPEQDYASMHDAFASAGREMPITRIRITTLITPNLDEGKHDEPFIPNVEGEPPFQFQIEAQDLDGSRIDFAVDMIFIPMEALKTINDAFKLARLQKLYEGRRANLRGQRVAFAESFAKPGAATLVTAAISFGAQTPGATSTVLVRNGLKQQHLPPGHPPFLPVVERADVTIPAIAQLVGSAGTSGSTTILFHEAYLAKGFAAENHGQAFAKFDPAFTLHIPAEKAGRLVTPSMSVDGLSRNLGAVSGVDDIANGAFKPEKVFDALEAKLLGTIELKTLIAEIVAPPTGTASLDLVAQVPKLLTTRTSTEVTTSYTWNPKVKRINDPLLPLVTTTGTGLSIDVRSIAALDGSKPPTFTVNGTLTAFALNLLDVIMITFDSLSFGSKDGSKGDLKATGVDVAFTGVLQFVETLARILPATGFSDGPAIAVTANGITTSYSIGVPNAGIGVFSLENIALSAALFLPFVDQPPSLRLAFSEPHHPFLVTVSLIGGGGYFGIVVNTKGVEKIDGALDLGGNISIDLVVASANVHVLAGFYFAIMKTPSQENPSDTVTDFIFTAFVRIGGSVEVLGIIGISVEIFVELSYQATPSPGTISGRASVTVGVHLLFFSKSIVLSVGCCFEIGTGALALKDPSFDDMVTLSDWTDYCRAFA